MKIVFAWNQAALDSCLPDVVAQQPAAAPAQSPTKYCISRSPSLKHALLLTRRSPSLFSSFPLSLSLSLSLGVSQRGHSTRQSQMAKDAPQLDFASPLCMWPTWGWDSLHTPSVCGVVCLCMRSLPSPGLLRYKHPLIKAIRCHPGSWEAGGSRGQRSVKGARHLSKRVSVISI